MPTAFENLPQAGFAGVQFPVSSTRLVGGLRDHVHEYPHSPGGAPEKLGRKLYECEMTIPAHNTYRKWPGLWPRTVAFLRTVYEDERTEDLTIPTVGTIPAYIYGWTETADSKKQSGVEVVIQFREDQSSAYLVEALIQTASRDLGGLIETALAEADDLDIPLDLFEGIQELGNDIAAIGDQIDLAGNQMTAKIEGITAAFNQGSNTLDSLAKPVNWKLLYAIRDAHEAAIDLHKKILKKATPQLIYTTPRRMSVSEVSIALYQTTDRAVEILSINALPDAFAIPPNFPILHYAA